jgi:cytochrome c peroxidase
MMLKTLHFITFIVFLESALCFKLNMRTVTSKDIPQSFKDISNSDFLSKLSIGISIGALALPLQTIARGGLTEEEKELQFNQKPDPNSAAIVTNGVKPDYAAVRQDISNFVNERPDRGPTLVRLAWHSSGTYDKMSKTGGSGKGTIRFQEELAHGGNAGLDIAVGWMEPIYKKYNKNADLSYADLYTLAGVEAIKTMRGPDIKWRAGRVDSMTPGDVTPDGRLPDVDKGSPKDT